MPRHALVPKGRARVAQPKAACAKLSHSGRPAATRMQVDSAPNCARRSGRARRVLGGGGACGLGPGRAVRRAQRLRGMPCQGRKRLARIAPRPCDAGRRRKVGAGQFRQREIRVRRHDVDLLRGATANSSCSTDGPDGKLADYEIKYTFGVHPLQQYLIELPGGRLQALSIAWDARPKAQGGQRWFHLYPGQNIKAGDWLHWTSAARTGISPAPNAIRPTCARTSMPRRMRTRRRGRS